MSVKIRLTRTGARNAACFRVVAADARSPRDGRFIETLGWYDPRLKADKCELKLDRIQYWQSVGAQLSDTVNGLVKNASRNKTEAPVPVPEPTAEEATAPAEEPVAAATEDSENARVETEAGA